MFIVFYFPTESAVVCAAAFQCGILSVLGLAGAAGGSGDQPDGVSGSQKD